MDGASICFWSSISIYFDPQVSEGASVAIDSRTPHCEGVVPVELIDGASVGAGVCVRSVEQLAVSRT